MLVQNINELMTLKQASQWASEHLGKNITTSNISYLIQYGKISKRGGIGDIRVDKIELLDYYNSYYGNREIDWKDQLGNDLNWRLSFDYLKEAETTKHVHRLHPYKGKFIPQLVEYFLDKHIDDFKKEVFFKKDDIVLDPFCGSGTTLVQANELGIHAIGVDVSAFNSLISNSKVAKYNLPDLQYEIHRITNTLRKYLANNKTIEFENELLKELSKFNSKHFPSPDYKRQVQQKLINEDVYGKEKSKEFLDVFNYLVKKYNIELLQKGNTTFLEKWYSQHIRNELNLIFDEIKSIQSPKIKKILSIILSRTMRSCRATTHADLATLKEPVVTTYYCSKHGKVCKPLFSILKWWETYSKDALKRLVEFDKYRTSAYQICLTGDSRTLNILEKLKSKNKEFAEYVNRNRINGIFTSPPYVGLIDYHEQHSYAYSLFGFTRNDELEIGSLSKGQSIAARQSYIQGISEVLKNCKRFLTDDFNIFLVANDKYNIYQTIADNSDLTIVNQFKRPVLNRTEKDKGAYSEIIFHLKQK